MKKIGILHISDIHINDSSILQIDSLVEKLIKDIEKVKDENRIHIDLIFFAGDLIGRGDMAFENEMQIQLAEEHFIQPLLNAIGLTKNEFILVPGNHEVDKRKIAKRTEAGLAAISSLQEINETVYDMQSEYNDLKKQIGKILSNSELLAPALDLWNDIKDQTPSPMGGIKSFNVGYKVYVDEMTFTGKGMETVLIRVMRIQIRNEEGEVVDDIRSDISKAIM